MMRRWRGRTALLVAVFAMAVILLAGVARAQTTPGQAAIDQLLLLVLVLAILMGVVVEGLLIVALIRFRRKRGFHLPARVKTGDPRLEFIWTAVPVLVIAIVGGATLFTLQITDTIPEGTVYIDVVAQRFSWSFVYPDGNSSEGLLRVQVNETVVLNITSTDVVHSYFISDFRLKVDAIPGRVNQYWFKAEQVGEYVVQCAEYCGVGHYTMVAMVEIFPEGSQPVPYGPAA